ncbi:hypothetical protein BH10PSE17_BH10PSE17_22700 [soil metagenome]
MSYPLPYRGSTPSTFDLAPGSVLPFRTARGVEVRSTLGRLWVTEEGTTGDHFLRPGERYRVRGAGRVVVEALDAARIEVHAPATPLVRTWRAVVAAFGGRAASKGLQTASR